MTGSGVLTGLFLKPQTPGQYGLPKERVRAAEVVPGGLVGDYNNYRQEELHGDPDSAILLMTEETLAALRVEGWPIDPGHLGENLLVRDLPYDVFTPPRRLRVGSRVVLTTTRACDPCHRLESLPYVGPGRGAKFMRTMLRRRGWYARVETPGPLHEGDPVDLL